MARDRAIGAGLLLAAVVGILVYGTLIFAFGSKVSLLVLEVTAFVAVLAVLAILGWIGYVMATTPTPEPLEPNQTNTTTESPAAAEQK